MSEESFDESENVNEGEIDDSNPFESNKNENKLNQKTTIKPHWESDFAREQCAQCFLTFNFFLRRHHCRGCGKLFCSKCCRHWILLPQEFDYENPERTCDGCWKLYSSIDFSKNYDCIGPADGKTLILLHPALFNRTFFSKQAKTLSKRFRVISVDLPAHGSQVDKQLTVDTSIQSIESLIRELVPTKRALLVGHGLGAMIAILFAQRHQELCLGLVLSSCCGDSTKGGNKIMYGALGALYSSMPQSLLWTLIPQSYPEIPREILNEAILRSGMTYESWDQLSSILYPSDPDIFKIALKSIKKPILFINGEKDFRKLEASYLDAAECSKLHVIKGGSSMTPLEPSKSEEWSEIVIEFAEEVN